MASNVEGSGLDYAYQHDMNVEFARGAAEAMRRVLAAVQIRHEFTADDVRQIARDMGVEL
jgi:hypothetical protein